MFFDNASTTKIDETIIMEFKKLNDEYFYNPGALYLAGRKSKDFIENCRKNILNKINATGSIIFTGSATEANNLALLGYVKKHTKKILVSMAEHPSIYNTALELKNKGFNVEFVRLNKNGQVDIDDYKSKLTCDVDLISIMHVCNETGAINDIEYLVSLAKDVNPNVIFHSDGVQAVGKIEVDVDSLGVDMYTMSAHKIHGMKGVGALYIRKGLQLKPCVFGGGQEGGLRSGTENILGIYSLSKSVEISIDNLDKNYAYVNELKNKFLQRISSSSIQVSNHSGDKNSPYIISISFLDCRAETLLNMLSDLGVYVGNGSACSSKKSGNRILESMGVSKDIVEGNLRISFSKYNTLDEVDNLCDALINVVEKYKFKTK